MTTPMNAPVTNAAQSPDRYLVAALYKFVALDALPALKEELTALANRHRVIGTLLVAPEGINGTIAAAETDMRAFLAALKAKPAFAGLVHKESWASEKPFIRMKVRIKREIVTMGVENIDPNQIVGTYVKPADWNALISDPDVVVVDTRNDYEVAIGTFDGAIDPKTVAFRDFPAWMESDAAPRKDQKVAMFCTGGIRCEKSTALLKQMGYPDVYHLEGGILKYLEEIPEENSLWQGDCFVFDERVSVRHGLVEGDYDLCHGCRHPITEQDKADERYAPGVCCPHCFDKTSPEQKARYAERQKQIALAKKRGEAHLGRQDSGQQDLAS